MTDLYAKGSTLKQIGNLYDISEQRVKQLIEKYEKINGLTKRIFFTIKHLIETTNTNYHRIKKLTKNKRFSAEEVNKIKQKIKIDFKTCCICNKKINYNLKYCSYFCLRKKQVKARLKLFKQKPSLQNTHNLTNEIFKKLTNISPGKTYVSFRKAVKLSGLTNMQLTWLRKRKIIAVKKTKKIHPVFKTCCHLYSQTQLLAIKELL